MVGRSKYELPFYDKENHVDLHMPERHTSQVVLCLGAGNAPSSRFEKLGEVMARFARLSL